MKVSSWQSSPLQWPGPHWLPCVPIHWGAKPPSSAQSRPNHPAWYSYIPTSAECASSTCSSETPSPAYAKILHPPRTRRGGVGLSGATATLLPRDRLRFEIEPAQLLWRQLNVECRNRGARL